MPFTYSLEEDKKDRHKFIMITGFEGSVRDLVVPEMIDGIRVEAIGNHSFSRRQDIEKVTLPESIRTLYGFAFHNCRNLKKITLYDSIDDYYDGVCRQCDSLSDIEITVNRSWFEVIRNFLADSDRTLRFNVKHKRTVSYDERNRIGQTICLDKGQDAAGKESTAESEYEVSSLTFPEYVYDFNENTMARTIQFSIAGSGMFYRECVDRRSINYREYDKLFEKAMIDGGRIAEDIAIGRLMYPVELDDDSRARYEGHIRDNAESILKRLIEESERDPFNVSIMRSLLEYKKALFDDKSIDLALKIATAGRLTEICAILMDVQNHDKKDSGASDAFSFEF